MLNFKNLRKEKNLTQKEFCDLIGVSPRSLSNYENGNTDISLKKLQEIADLLKIDFFKLFEKKISNEVSEPVDNYNLSKENSLLLQQNYNSLKENQQIKDDIINMLKLKVAMLEDNLAECEQQKKQNNTIK